MTQNLVFENDGKTIRILTPEGAVLLAASFFTPPIAIHDSYEFPAGAEQSVTHVPSGLAFRRQMTPDAALALAEALLADIGNLWALDWFDPEDMDADEETNLTTLLGSHPDDYVGSINVTTTGVVAAGTEIWVCPTDPTFPSYNDVTDGAGNVIIAGVRPGEYTVYAYDPTGANDWGTQVGTTTVVLDVEEVVTVDVVDAAPHAIPCKP